ncbi:MAG: hypothetical protein JWL97_3704 [Gemmatimonadales bacterium]|nr:hypothetical protein [Gemmatimonadales bacterium]
MSFDVPRHREGTASIDVPAPANPRVTPLEALARAIGEKYPAIRTRLDVASPGRPARLRTAYRETFENIKCDFTDDGWYYSWSFGTTRSGRSATLPERLTPSRSCSASACACNPALTRTTPACHPTLR